MNNENCKDLENLPLYLSWNRHCGGGWWELTSRIYSMADSALLTRLSIIIGMVPGPIPKLFGLALFSKAVNDAYESTTGNRGALRKALGDELYLVVDLSLMSYGLFQKIPKIDYLGNPMRDFFVKDPSNYESAFKQYGAAELVHFVVGSGMSAYNNYDTYSGTLNIEEAWQGHIARSGVNYDQ